MQWQLIFEYVNIYDQYECLMLLHVLVIDCWNFPDITYLNSNNIVLLRRARTFAVGAKSMSPVDIELLFVILYNIITLHHIDCNKFDLIYAHMSHRQTYQFVQVIISRYWNFVIRFQKFF